MYFLSQAFKVQRVPQNAFVLMTHSYAFYIYVAKFVSVFIIKHPAKRLKAVLSIQLHKFYGAESAVGLFSSSSFPSTTLFVQNNQIYH